MSLHLGTEHARAGGMFSETYMFICVHYWPKDNLIYLGVRNKTRRDCKLHWLHSNFILDKNEFMSVLKMFHLNRNKLPSFVFKILICVTYGVNDYTQRNYFSFSKITSYNRICCCIWILTFFKVKRSLVLIVMFFFHENYISFKMYHILTVHVAVFEVSKFWN